MSKNNQNTNAVIDDLDAEIEAMIAEEANDASEQPVAQLTEEVIEIEAISDDVLDDIDTELRVDDALAEVYAEDENAPAVAAANDEDEDDGSSKVTSISTASRRPRSGVGRNAKPSEALPKIVPNLLEAAMVTVGEQHDQASLDALLGKLDGLAVKVRTKAINLVANRKDPTKLENYTRIGLEVVAEKLAAGEMTVTSEDLYKRMKARPYTDGTSRAQSNQLMQLFPALGIASREGRSALKIDPKSAILADFKAA